VTRSISTEDNVLIIKRSIMLFNRHEIRDHLSRMPLIRHTIPNRHTSMFYKRIYNILFRNTEHDSIKHRTKYSGRIQNGLFLTELNVTFNERFTMRTKIITRYNNS